jgi:hypothetical protein
MKTWSVEINGKDKTESAINAMGTIWNGSNLAEDMFVELNRAQPLGADVF